MAKYRAVVKFLVTVEADSEEAAYNYVDEYVGVNGIEVHDLPGFDVEYDGMDYPLEEQEPKVASR